MKLEHMRTLSNFNDLPAPLAAMVSQLLKHSEAGPKFQHDLCYFSLELYLKFVMATLTGHLLTTFRSDPAALSELQDELYRGMQKPSLGHWLNVYGRTVQKRVNAITEKSLQVFAEMFILKANKHELALVHQLQDKLKNYGVDLDKVKYWSEFPNFIANYRNKMIGHGSCFAHEDDYVPLFNNLMEILIYFLQICEKISVDWIFFQHIGTEHFRKKNIINDWIQGDTESCFKRISLPLNLNHLYLGKKVQEDQNNQDQITIVADYAGWLYSCYDNDSEFLCFFNGFVGSKGERSDYLCYHNGHHFRVGSIVPFRLNQSLPTRSPVKLTPLPLKEDPVRQRLGLESWLENEFVDPTGNRCFLSDICASEEPLILISGEAGMGKTETLRQIYRLTYLAHQRGEGTCPVWINLANYSSEINLERLLKNALQLSELEFFRFPPLLLLLDGLNEVPFVLQKVLTSDFRNLFEQMAGQRWIITGRNHVQELDRLMASPLRPWKINPLAMAVMTPWLQNEGFSELADILSQRHDLATLAQSPFLLLAMLELSKSGLTVNELPEKRGLLLKQLVDSLFLREGKEKCLMTPEEVQSYKVSLIKLAGMMQKKRMTRINAELLFEKHPQIKPMVNFALSCGLMIKEKAFVGFYHQLIGEYLSSENLMLSPNPWMKKLDLAPFDEFDDEPVWFKALPIDQAVESRIQSLHMVLDVYEDPQELLTFSEALLHWIYLNLEYPAEERQSVPLESLENLFLDLIAKGWPKPQVFREKITAFVHLLKPQFEKNNGQLQVQFPRASSLWLLRHAKDFVSWSELVQMAEQLFLPAGCESHIYGWMYRQALAALMFELYPVQASEWFVNLLFMNPLLFQTWMQEIPQAVRDALIRFNAPIRDLYYRFLKNLDFDPDRENMSDLDGILSNCIRESLGLGPIGSMPLRLRQMQNLFELYPDFSVEGIIPCAYLSSDFRQISLAGQILGQCLVSSPKPWETLLSIWQNLPDSLAYARYDMFRAIWESGALPWWGQINFKEVEKHPTWYRSAPQDPKQALKWLKQLMGQPESLRQSLGEALVRQYLLASSQQPLQAVQKQFPNLIKLWQSLALDPCVCLRLISGHVFYRLVFQTPNRIPEAALAWLAQLKDWAEMAHSSLRECLDLSGLSFWLGIVWRWRLLRRSRNMPEHLRSCLLRDTETFSHTMFIPAHSGDWLTEKGAVSLETFLAEIYGWEPLKQMDSGPVEKSGDLWTRSEKLFHSLYLMLGHEDYLKWRLPIEFIASELKPDPEHWLQWIMQTEWIRVKDPDSFHPAELESLFDKIRNGDLGLLWDTNLLFDETFEPSELSHSKLSSGFHTLFHGVSFAPCLMVEIEPWQLDGLLQLQEELSLQPSTSPAILNATLFLRALKEPAYLGSEEQMSKILHLIQKYSMRVSPVFPALPWPASCESLPHEALGLNQWRQIFSGASCLVSPADLNRPFQFCLYFQDFAPSLG